MAMWRGKTRWTGLTLLLILLGCSDRAEEQQSLRDALARLPRDTTTPPPDVEPEDALPVDSTIFGVPGEPVSLPDSAGFLDPETLAVPIERDTTPIRLTPGRPQDTEPWIPEQEPLPLTAEWTDGPVEEAGSGARMTVLASVRTARNDGYDRVVFQFESGRMPGYRIEYVGLPVRQCGSGQAVPLPGDRWLRVRLQPSQAHDERGRATVQDRSRTADLPVLRELRLICDYEGQVEWVLGLASEQRFRVLELNAPARLVLDILH